MCRRGRDCAQSAAASGTALKSKKDLLKDYLTSWAEPLAQPDYEPHNDADQVNVYRINACRSGRYRWVLIIPAFDEQLSFASEVVQNIRLQEDALGVLVICVINAPDDATAEQITRTRKLLPPANSIEPKKIAPGIHELTIDAVTHPLPGKQATGLARKLGNDIACELLSAGHIKTPLLCNTDADAVLPPDYFARLTRAHAEGLNHKPRTTALVLPFLHKSDDPALQPELQEAGVTYELYLRSLQLNLQRCGSPYAYPALGSVLAVSPIDYAKSRGFPKRRAGEDFYLLNKFAKLGQVHYLTGEPVILAARASHRVPFGTGPALKKLLDAEPNEISAPTYALASYALLRQFYVGVSELKADELSPAGRNLPAPWRDPDLLWLLKKIGLPGALVRLQKNFRTDQALQRSVIEWFDALKTIRFLNEARHFHPDEPLHSQLDHMTLFLPEEARAAVDKTAGQMNSMAELNRALESARTESWHSVTLWAVANYQN